MDVSINFVMDESADTIEGLFGVDVTEDGIIDQLLSIVANTETPIDSIIEIFKREKGAKAIILYQVLMQAIH
jgi:hypothetical protein